jgi:hypothetical protein
MVKNPLKTEKKSNKNAIKMRSIKTHKYLEKNVV